MNKIIKEINTRVAVGVRVDEGVNDDPNVNFGRGLVKLSVFVDEMLFRHRFSSDLTQAKQFVAINIGFLKKQLKQQKIAKHIDFEVVVNHFEVAPFYDTHEWQITTYLTKFCEWVRSDEKRYGDANIILSGLVFNSPCSVYNILHPAHPSGGLRRVGSPHR